ncbi:MAG: substrate-binding domain-containing protein [Bacteroidales bacterium]|jgi:phosphate transport system substrate-binding protein|nr:substrate-binding domain-containing protein [Bacteroidales bacterium]MDD4214959.1 substrate-binding domain-containing protein [Bacteroidales bacterium]
MKKLLFLLRIALISVFFSCTISCNGPVKEQKSKDLKGKISISGAFAMYPLTVEWAEEFKKIHPDVTMDISAGGAGKGMVDVMNGLVDIAMFSREVSPEEKSKGAWYIATAKDAVLPTINKSNPVFPELAVKGLKRQDFIDIFITGSRKNWSGLVKTSNNKINLYTRSDACGAAEMWAKYLGKKQEDLKGVGVYGDPGICDAVKNDKYGIGFNNIAYAYDPATKENYNGIGIIPLDINEDGIIDSTESFYDNLDKLINAIKKGQFPSPPARELYFITKGKPEKPVIIEFLRFVLNEGQKYVHEAGYVELSDEKVKAEIEKLN